MCFPLFSYGDGKSENDKANHFPFRGLLSASSMRQDIPFGKKQEASSTSSSDLCQCQDCFPTFGVLILSDLIPRREPDPGGVFVCVCAPCVVGYHASTGPQKGCQFGVKYYYIRKEEGIKALTHKTLKLLWLVSIPSLLAPAAP